MCRNGYDGRRAGEAPKSGESVVNVLFIYKNVTRAEKLKAKGIGLTRFNLKCGDE